MGTVLSVFIARRAPGMTTVARAPRTAPRVRGQFVRDARLRFFSASPRAVARPRRTPTVVTPTSLMRAEAADFELLRVLGQVSFVVESSSERTLMWSGGEDGTVPDSISVSGSGQTQGDAVMKLYAGKVVGWDDGKLNSSNAVPDVLLKEYVNAAAATMADNEVTAYQTLYSDPNDSTIGQMSKGDVFGEAFDPASLPIVPLIAFFSSKPVAGNGYSEDNAGSLWTVQAWGAGGLNRLANYPSQKQEIYEQKWWPPVQRSRDAGSGPRMRYVRNAVNGVFSSLQAIHCRNVSHGAIDASSFQVNTLSDGEADDLEIRLMNFGFSQPLTPENKRQDLCAAAVVCAELIFSSLALNGPSQSTTAVALTRLFEDVFLLDDKEARLYFIEEENFTDVVEFLEYRDRQGDGWRLLVDCWRGDSSAEEILARAEAVETPYD